MERDGLGDQQLDLFSGLGNRHTSRKVRHKRAPRVAILLDDGKVLSHHFRLDCGGLMWGDHETPRRRHQVHGRCP